MDDSKQAIVAVAVASAALGASSLKQQQDRAASIAAAVSTINLASTSTRRVPNGRYRRSGALPRPTKSFWRRVDEIGDDLEFLHFTSLTRESFNELVTLCTPYIRSNGIAADAKGPPKPCHLSRRVARPRDIIAMTIRFLLSTAEYKDLHVHFGVVLTTYVDCVQLGIQALIKMLFKHSKSRVFWDRSIDKLKESAEKTASFLDIPSVVAMVDGTKVETKAPGEYLLQNRDYNGWTKDVNRNMVLVWDPFGKIVDCAINLPGNFHDSKSAWWCHLYKHFEDLPAPYKCVCDDAFYTGGSLSGKLVKTKERYVEGASRSSYDQSLTHLRQCSEWGNNILTGCWRRLRTKLPTNNVARGQIMWACILMHNWRTETVGRNQIKTYFDDIIRQADAEMNTGSNN